MRDVLERCLAPRYAVAHELGRGGMATVWLARDLRYDRPVALKVLHPELAGAIGVDRFLREVQVTARLQHPGIVPLLDSGIVTLDDGTRVPWFIMPYLAGESLRSRLAREGQLPVATALRIAAEAADALGAAHAHGIVHRDVKPENILLVDDRVYIVDFGIAKAVLASGDDRLTMTGLAIGTPAYMSPEQAAAGTVDARSDQYGLACVVYEMLAGEPPFTGPTAQAILARRFAEPARPFRSVRSTVPAAVERAVLRALERVPADRFETLADFAAALEEGQSGATPALPARRVPALLLAAVLLAAAGTGVGLLWRLGPRGGTGERDGEILSLYQLGVRGYDRRTTAGAQEAVAAFKAALARDSTYAAAWNGLARTYVRAYQRQFILPGIPADSMLRLAVAAADRAVAAAPGSAEVWLTRAVVSQVIDPTDVGVPIRSARRAIALDSGNASAWHTLALSLAEGGDLDQALEAWRESVRRSPSYAQGVAFLAIGHYWRRQFDSAAVWADSAIALDPNYLLGRNTAGLVAVEQGHLARAAAAFEAARRLSTDVDLITALAGRTLVEAREGAGERARSTLRLADSLAVSSSATSLHTVVFLAQAHAAVGQTGRALEWLTSYAPAGDLHFQLHLRCDPPFDRLAQDARFRTLLLPINDPAGRAC